MSLGVAFSAGESSYSQSSVRPSRSYAVFRLLPPRGLIVARSQDLRSAEVGIVSGWGFGRSARSRRCGSRSWWREMICNFDLLCSALQAMYTPPRHTTPMGFPSFQTTRNNKTENRKQNKTKHRNIESIRDGQAKQKPSQYLPSFAIHR